MKKLLIGSALALAAIVGSGPGALAQSGEEMRTLNAAPMDIADGKHVAEMDCAACHNLNGISTVKGTPHIAGQRPAYLYLTLKEYKSGVRSSEAMTSAIKFLSDDALIKVAAYFASLDPAPAPGGGFCGLLAACRLITSRRSNTASTVRASRAAVGPTSATPPSVTVTPSAGAAFASSSAVPGRKATLTPGNFSGSCASATASPGGESPPAAFASASCARFPVAVTASPAGNWPGSVLYQPCA